MFTITFLLILCFYLWFTSYLKQETLEGSGAHVVHVHRPMMVTLLSSPLTSLSQSLSLSILLSSLSLLSSSLLSSLLIKPSAVNQSCVGRGPGWRWIRGLPQGDVCVCVGVLCVCVLVQSVPLVVLIWDCIVSA